MTLSTRDQSRDRRFQLRATVSEETLIKVAAERQGINVTMIRHLCVWVVLLGLTGATRAASWGEEFFDELSSFFSFFPSSLLSVALDELVLEDEPSNVNVSTLPIWVKNGTIVRRT